MTAQGRMVMPLAKVDRCVASAFVIGLLVALAGLVFSLQGAGIVPGSYMTGSRLWLAIGLLMVVAGAAMAAWGKRGPAS